MLLGCVLSYIYPGYDMERLEGFNGLIFSCRHVLQKLL